MDYNKVLNILKNEGYKITPQRKAIIEILILNSENLISVDCLLHQSKEHYSKTNLSTVYRNLEIMESLNLIYKVIDEDGMALYKLSCPENEHHHHIICKQCGKTEVINFCPIDVFTQLSKEKHFNLTGHKLELYGQCKDCNDTFKNNNK